MNMMERPCRSMANVTPKQGSLSGEGSPFAVDRSPVTGTSLMPVTILQLSINGWFFFVVLVASCLSPGNSPPRCHLLKD